MISVDYEQVVYNGNGIQNAWPYSFPIYDGDVVRLILLDADGTETNITQDYFVDVPGSTVYYPGYVPGAEPPLEDQPPKVQTGQKLIVYRDTEITQDSDLGDSWPFSVIEKGLDKLTMILQEKAFALARCLKISKGQAAEIDDYDTTVPLAADKVICGNAAGNGFEAREALMEVNGAWDGEGRKIYSIANPTDQQEVATKNYVDNIVAGIIAEGNDVIVVDNVATMINTDLTDGMYVGTAGYHEVNDGGNGFYAIRAKDVSDVEDGGSIIFLDNGNVAELITDGTVRPEQFGAYGDNSHDDTDALQKAFDTNLLLVSEPNKTYLVTSSITIGSRHTDVQFEGALNYTGNDFLFEITCAGRVYDCEFRFGELSAYSGSVFHITPNSGNDGYCAGVLFSATNVHANSTSGYVFKVDSTGWFNENFIENMNVASANYLFYMDMTDPDARCSRLEFSRVHIEGPKHGVYIDAGDHVATGILFNNCRMEEAIDNYFCNINSSVTDHRLAYAIVNVINAYAINHVQSLFVGNVFYCFSTGQTYIQYGAFAITSGSIYYNGVCINPPFLSNTVKTGDVGASTVDVDFNNGLGLVFLRTSSTVQLNVTPVPLPYGTYKFPIQSWVGGVVTVSVPCYSATKTVTYTSASNEEIKWIHVDYTQNKIFIE